MRTRKIVVELATEDQCKTVIDIIESEFIPTSKDESLSSEPGPGNEVWFTIANSQYPLEEDLSWVEEILCSESIDFHEVRPAEEES